MAFTINPPNSPIVDNRGVLTPEWYRFLAAVQRVVGSDLVEQLQQARYVTWQAETILPNDRLLAAGTGLDLTLDASNASLSLEDTAVVPGVYGAATKTVIFTVDQQGRLTSASAVDLNTDNIIEGLSNLFYTTVRARGSISVSGSLAYDSGTGVISYTTPNSDGITEGVTNLYYTNARARAALSAGAGITYNSGTGEISVTKTLNDGTYTPTLTNGANVAASTASVCQWLQVGDTVTVSGRVDIDPTSASTGTALGISLPVASNFSTAANCGGTAVSPNVASMCAAIYADQTNDRAELYFVTGADVANRDWYFSFTYRVL